MTTRERWTVYPLLLLAIGLAVRGSGSVPGPAPGRHEGSVTADTIYCKEFAVVTDNGQIVVHAARVKDGGGGRVEIRDAQGIDSMAIGTTAESRDGVIEFFDAEGHVIGRFPKR